MDKERAKQIIVEIIRAAGGTLTTKTCLFKAFYHAHMKYAESHPDVLSDWPIVRMPRGPGIDRFDQLLGELLGAGVVHLDTTQMGPYEAFQFTLTGAQLPVANPLNDAALAAIRAGVKEIDGKTAAIVSEESHLKAWERTPNGREMNIYIDLPSEDESEESRSQAANIAAAFRKVI